MKNLPEQQGAVVGFGMKHLEKITLSNHRYPGKLRLIQSQKLVNRLIDGQVADGFFTDCPITFRDIAQAKQVLTERLMSIYHTRIQYPEPK